MIGGDNMSDEEYSERLRGKGIKFERIRRI